MLDPDLLKLLCCPDTHQTLCLADPQLLQALNRKIAEGSLRNRAGRPVGQPLEEGLLREDRKVLYPVRNSIAVMLTDEAIPLEVLR